MGEMIRTAAFQWVEKQVNLHGDFVPRKLLDQGFQFQGKRIPLVGPQSICKHAAMELPISIYTLDDYIYEGVLVLLCHIGAFSAIRYPTLKDGEAYKKILIKYSGMEEFFNQIDLLFFYQGPRSKFQDNGNYRKLNNYDEIKSVLVGSYGKEEELDCYSKRFVKQEEVIATFVKANIAGFNVENFLEKLPLFSLAEIAYRYLRCGAVHNITLCFINTDFSGDVEEGYIITKEIL